MWLTTGWTKSRWAGLRSGSQVYDLGANWGVWCGPLMVFWLRPLAMAGRTQKRWGV
jgi:hypothetical protein